jgi:rhamnose transport system permease protein
MRQLRALITARETGILLALVLVVLATTAKNPAFVFSPDGFRDLLLSPATLVLIAVGEAMVIITRNVDLSVGSVIGLSAYTTGFLFKYTHLPIAVVVIAAILLGAVLGLINGLLISIARVPSLVITLGTLYAYRGINVIWTGSNRINGSDMPASFLDVGTAKLWVIPVISILAAIVLIGAAFYLRNTRAGRELFAIGSDPDAANLYGLKVGRRVLVAFITSGTLAGVAGVLYTARYGTVDSQAGSGLELQAVGAAVIGGVAIFGGSGSVWGAAIGAVLLVTINRALPVLGIQAFWQQFVVGVLIIAAIVLDRVVALRQARRLTVLEDSRA